ncbi:hypothetical protein BDV95DRAFT_597502 [Massariosphaeria phaeospora]|uniref:Uncharacterized protein n=1 Tax=Massariosphaeria phaeospora TaxID=100035 RepID=A0A7C8I1B9_9PLEO|nr:hypothetical protein BDV95DRAFT_597502 [Massariosphaeria phaeospora]
MAAQRQRGAEWHAATGCRIRSVAGGQSALPVELAVAPAWLWPNIEYDLGRMPTTPNGLKPAAEKGAVSSGEDAAQSAAWYASGNDGAVATFRSTADNRAASDNSSNEAAELPRSAQIESNLVGMAHRCWPHPQHLARSALRCEEHAPTIVTTPTWQAQAGPLLPARP